MLASVARHSEQKRLVAIPEVSWNVAQSFYNPGPPDYLFNPVTLFSRLSGEESVLLLHPTSCLSLTFSQRIDNCLLARSAICT